MTSTYDVAIIGGGPAGSTCARTLVAGGARVRRDRSSEVPAREAVRGLVVAGDLGRAAALARRVSARAVAVERCHVRYPAKDHAIPCTRLVHPSFRARRLPAAAARAPSCISESTSSRSNATIDGGLVPIGGRCSRALSHRCGRHALSGRAVARTGSAAPRRSACRSSSCRPILRRSRARESAATASPSSCCSTTSAATDGTCPSPTGSTSAAARSTRATCAPPGSTTHEYLQRARPRAAEAAEPELEHVKGHSYYLFDLDAPRDARSRDDARGAFLVGDCARPRASGDGRRHPAGGVSGRCAAEAILANDAAGATRPGWRASR